MKLTERLELKRLLSLLIHSEWAKKDGIIYRTAKGLLLRLLK